MKYILTISDRLSARHCIVVITAPVLGGFSCQRPGPGADKQKGQEQEKEEKVSAYLKKEVNPLFTNLDFKEASRRLDSIQGVLGSNSTPGTYCTFWRFKSVYFTLTHQFDSAAFYLKKSASLAPSTDNPKKHLLGANIQYADLYEEQKNYPTALKYAREAYAMTDKKDSATLAYVCLRLALIYSAMKERDLAYRYQLEGFHASTQPRYRMTFANNIANYYDKKGKTDSALRFFKAYVVNDTSLTHPYYDAVRHENLGALLIKTHQPDSGLVYLQIALQRYKKANMVSGTAYFNMAEGWSQLDKYTISNQYLDTALAISREEKDITNQKDSWKLRAYNLKQLGRSQDGYNALDSSYKYYKTEVDSSLINQARELETQYEVKNKDQRIALLTVSNAANKKIAKQNKIIAIILTGLMKLPVIIIWLWARRRKLQQQLRQVELEQQLLRSQMEPHFIFNSLSVLRGLINQGERASATSYLSKFAGLLRLNLKNSRSGLVLLTEELEALSHYLGLQAGRFPDVFDYEIICYNGYEDDEVMILPMLLQPFVENAIQHGMRNISYKGKLTVTVEKPDAKTIICKIDDNGCGIHSAGGIKNNAISTSITRERLAILAKQTGRKASIRIIDKAGSGETGTIVELIIPV